MEGGPSTEDADVLFASFPMKLNEVPVLCLMLPLILTTSV